MKHKKILAILLGLMLIFAFTACGDDGSDTGTDDASQTTTGSDQGESDSTASDSGTDSSNSSDSKTGGTSKSYGPLLTALKKADLYAGTLTTGVVGDTMKNSFFNWKVNSVKTATKLSGKSAGSGKKFVVVSITVKNTTDEDYEVGNYDFIGYMEASEDGHLDTEDSFYDSMYPNETTLSAGKSLTGDLVFVVDSDVDEIVVDYIEFYGDDSTGNTNWVDLKF